VDIDGDTLSITAATVRRGLRKRTRALIVVHTLGYPAPMEDLVGIGVPILEDCALALGTTYRGRPVGTMGALSVFSLYATKVICAGEGGMVCSDDRGIVERVRDLNGVDLREDLRLRYNYKLSDLAAGVALGQLRRLPAMLARRRAIAAQYRRAFEGCPADVQQVIPGGRPNYYRFLLRSPRAARIIAAARKIGIGCDRPVFRPLHRYLDVYTAQDFPGTEAAFNSAVSVPIYPALSDREVAQISKGMRRILG
jgi:dTDP-4-amino-4,6-dideoxygalactose transaminase